MATEEKPQNLIYADGQAPVVPPTEEAPQEETQGVTREPASVGQATPMQQTQNQKTQIQEPTDPNQFNEQMNRLNEQVLQDNVAKNQILNQGLSKQQNTLQQIVDDTQQEVKRIRLSRQKARDNMNAAMKEVDALSKEKINPSRYFNSMNSWNRFLATVAVGASGVSTRALGLGTNSALSIMKKIRDNDVKLQKEELQNRRDAASQRYNHYKTMYEFSQDEFESEMKTTDFMSAIMAKQLDLLTKRSGIPTYAEMGRKLLQDTQKTSGKLYENYIKGKELQAKLSGSGGMNLKDYKTQLEITKLARKENEANALKRSLQSVAPPTGVGLRQGEKIQPLILNTDNRKAQENALKSINDAKEGLMTGQSIKRNFKQYIDAGFFKQFTSGIVSNEASQALSTLKSDVVKLAAKARLATLGGGQLSDQEFRLLRTITTGNPTEEQFSTFINFFKGKQDRFIAVINHMERAIARKYNADLRANFSNQGKGYEIGFMSRRKGEEPEIDQQSLKAFLEGSRTGEIKR